MIGRITLPKQKQVSGHLCIGVCVWETEGGLKEKKNVLVKVHDQRGERWEWKCITRVYHLVFGFFIIHFFVRRSSAFEARLSHKDVFNNTKACFNSLRHG